MEAKRFGKVYNIRCVCCYGGGSKWEQCKALEGWISHYSINTCDNSDVYDNIIPKTTFKLCILVIFNYVHE